MGERKPLLPAALKLVKIKYSLDNLALELLKGRFPSVDVEPYYRLAEAYIEKTLRSNRAYRRNMMRNSTLETLILLSMDAVATAFVLITGNKDEDGVNGLLKDYERMVGDCLKGMGL